MFVLTLIARTDGALAGLDQKLDTLSPTAPASFTFADEIQAVFEDGERVARAAMLAAAGAKSWIGIGSGSSLEKAQANSRAAVEVARTGSPLRYISVQGARNKRDIAEQASGVLRLMYRTVAERSETEQKVASYVVPGVRGQLKSIAQVLGISPQAVSKTLTRAKWHEEQACYPAVAALLDALNS